MTTLETKILASLEAHGKCDMRGLYGLYPQYLRHEIDAAVISLDKQGWAHYRLSMVVDGNKVDIPNVRRSNKTLYTQPDLFDPHNG